MPPGRVGRAAAGADHLLGPGARDLDVEPEFGAEHGRQAMGRGRLGEAHHPVHAVVIGDRERLQAQAHRLFGQLFG